MRINLKIRKLVVFNLNKLTLGVSILLRTAYNSTGYITPLLNEWPSIIYVGVYIAEIIHLVMMLIL